MTFTVRRRPALRLLLTRNTGTLLAPHRACATSWRGPYVAQARTHKRHHRGGETAERRIGDQQRGQRGRVMKRKWGLGLLAGAVALIALAGAPARSADLNFTK